CPPRPFAAAGSPLASRNRGSRFSSGEGSFSAADRRQQSPKQKSFSPRESSDCQDQNIFRQRKMAIGKSKSFSPAESGNWQIQQNFRQRKTSIGKMKKFFASGKWRLAIENIFR